LNLRFLDLLISDFKCFKGQHRLALGAYGPGLIFVKGINRLSEARLGSNGAGKSSLWDALTWCLYGRTVGGLRTPDLRPWTGGKPCVSVLLEIDGHEHALTRATDPTRLELDGAPASQEDVERLIRLNLETFAHTILLGQGQPLFFDLRPQAKMDLLTAVLDLNRWDDRAARASKRASLLGQREAAVRGEVLGLETALLEIDDLITETKASAKDWEASRQRRIEAGTQERAALEKQFKELEARAIELDLAYDGAEVELRATEDECRKIADALDKAEAKRRAYVNAKARIMVIDAEVEELEKGVCPTCKQPFKESRAQQQALLNEKKTCMKTLALTKDYKMKALNAQMEMLLAEADQWQAKARGAQDGLYRINPVMADVKAKLEAVRQDSDRREDEPNPYYDQLKGLQSRKIQLEKDKSERAERLERLGRLLERTRFWVRGFKDLRLHLMAEVLDELELVTNSALEELGLIGWQVFYDVERETKKGTIQRGITVTILSRNESPVRWESWSGGEGQRLRLLSSLALSEVLLGHVGVEIDTEILDEPTQHLSPEGVTDLCDFLTQRATHLGRRIWYVDHHSMETARFSDVVTVTTDERGTRIE
jgi:DNA repair exonuclease SbcCD ATPase subunit